MFSRRSARHGATSLATVLFVLTVAGAARAQSTPYVAGVRIDDTTQGSWQGRYGTCFSLIPLQKPRTIYPEVRVGPDLFSFYPEQYERAAEQLGTSYVIDQCKGGRMYDDHSINWRVFTKNGAAAFVYSLCEAGDTACSPYVGNLAAPGASQLTGAQLASVTSRRTS
jgi:hypothetical protein